MTCPCCGFRPPLEGSEFCVVCQRDFQRDDHHQQNYDDPERDAFLYEFGEEPSQYARRDFTRKEVRGFARELHQKQRRKGTGR